MLRDWLPFLIYGFMAFAIPASMIAMSFAFAHRPTRRLGFALQLAHYDQ